MDRIAVRMRMMQATMLHMHRPESLTDLGKLGRHSGEGHGG